MRFGDTWTQGRARLGTYDDHRISRARAMIAAEDVVINLAGLRYSDQHKRNQSIFEHLLSQADPFTSGVFIEPPWVSDRRAGIAARSSRLLRALRATSPRPRIRVLQPAYVLPFSGRTISARVQSELWSRRIRRLVDHRPYWLWINNFDFHAHHLARLVAPKARRVVVDLSDDFTTFRDIDPRGLQLRLREALTWADGLVAVNDNVARKFPHPRTLVFANATDYDAFQRWDPSYRLGDVLPKTRQQQIVGFIGGLVRERVDQSLLFNLLDAVPEATYLFVGYSNDPALVARLESRHHVRFFPTVPRAHVASVIRSFDVAIVPHADNEFTRGNDLLKIRDCMACGVPVVTTRCSGVDRFKHALWVAEDPAQFIAYVRGLLAGSLRHDPEPGMELARQESWPVVVPRLTEWLREVVAKGPRAEAFRR